MTPQKKRFPRLLYLLTALLCLILAGITLWSNNLQVPSESLPAPDELKLSPATYADYLVIPYNIAPLNFQIDNEAYDFITCFSATKGKPILVKGNNVRIKERSWKTMLESNKGEMLMITVYVKRDGIWFRYPTVRYQIASDPIDTWVIFRTTQPAFTGMGEMGIVQRNLESFQEKKLISIQRTDAPRYSELSNALFPVFHPSLPIFASTVNKKGQSVSFLDNELSTSFAEGACIRFKSTEANYSLKTQTAPTNASTVEAFPSWSKDGKYLFSSIALVGNDASKATQTDKIRFNLARRIFFPSTSTTGPADTLVNAAQLGRSAVTPRVSPDGRYVLFCMTDNGNKPLWHKSSDLYLLDLSNGAWRQLDILNSPDVDNQPCWSSNGRWILFGSNRTDGTYTRLYMAYFDKEGMIHKPFILPQRNPSDDEQVFASCNTPEFFVEPNTTGQLRLMSYLLDAFDGK